VNAKKENEALEQRIAAALTATDMAADVIADLLAEAEEAMIAADEAVEVEYERAHDVLISPDADKAREALQLVEFRRDRLRTALTQLEARWAQVAAAEDAAKWEADYESRKAERDALAREFPQLYSELSDRLANFFHRVAAVDKECERVNGTASAGEHRRLLGVELTARNLDNFSHSNPSIIDAVRLPTFEQSDRMAWPLPQIPLAAILAASMTPPHDPRFSANWAAARDQDKARRADAEARWAKEKEMRQAESRRAYEASLRR
jgi:hypothetical protein